MPYLGNNLGVAFSSYKLIDSLTASFNGTTTSFALTVNGVTPVPFPLNEQNILISVGGVPQKPDPTGAEGFRFSGSNIVFSSAPKTGEAFWGVVLAGADRVNAGVQYPDGTASVPSISFASQTTTGFYRTGSGQIGVGINGSTPVVFSTSGVQLNGSTSGSVIIASPAVAGNNTLTLPTSSGSIAAMIPGEVKWFAMVTPPSGFLKANGSAISRTTYANLFAAIGTTYGVGDGSTTFNLPDLRGEFVRGWDDGRGVDTSRTIGSFQNQAYLSHNHGISDPGHAHNYARQDWGAAVQGGGTYTVGGPVVEGTAAAVTGISVQSSGGTETRPRNIALLACIAF